VKRDCLLLSVKVKVFFAFFVMREKADYLCVKPVFKRGIHMHYISALFAFLAGGFLPLIHLLFDDLAPIDLLPTVGNKFLKVHLTPILVFITE